MTRREERLNNANAAKRMTDFLGHSNNFATLSLSQALAYTREVVTRFLFYARVVRVKGSASRVQSGARSSYAEAQPALARKGNIRLFLVQTKRSRLVFLSPSDYGGGDGDRRKATIIFFINNISSIQQQ